MLNLLEANFIVKILNEIKEILLNTNLFYDIGHYTMFLAFGAGIELTKKGYCLLLYIWMNLIFKTYLFIHSNILIFKINFIFISVLIFFITIFKF